MPKAEFARPYSEEELTLDMNWAVFAEYAQKEPVVLLLYELLRPDPKTSGHLEAYQALMAGDWDHINLLDRAFDQLLLEDERFREEVFKPIHDVVQARRIDALWKEFVLDPFSSQTAELSLRILAAMGNKKKARQCAQNYWLHYTRAYSKVEQERGPRSHANGHGYDWDAAVQKQAVLNEIWDEAPLLSAEEQKKELLRQIDELRKKIITETIEEYFSRSVIHIGLEAVQEGGRWREIDYFTQTVPLTHEQFQHLRVVPITDPHISAEYHFYDMQGNRVHLAVHTATGRWTSFEHLDTSLDLALSEHYGWRLPEEDFYRIKLYRAGQERYLQEVAYQLKLGNESELIEWILNFFRLPIDVYWQKGLIHNIGLEVQWDAANVAAYYGHYESPFYFEKRDEASLRKEKPPLLDQIPPELLVLQERRKKTYGYGGGTEVGPIKLPNDHLPTVVDKEDLERRSQRKILRVSVREGLHSDVARYLDYPMKDDLIPENFVSAKLSRKPTDVMISAVREFDAEGAYLPLPVPLDSKLTKIRLTHSETQKILRRGENFELVERKATGHVAVHLLKPWLQNGSFRYSLEIALPNTKTQDSENILLNSEVVESLSKMLRNENYICFADELDRFSGRHHLSLRDVQRAFKDASLYTYKARYTYQFGNSELRRLGGFLDYKGQLHLQCSGAAAFGDEFFRLYEKEAQSGLSSVTGSCIVVKYGEASEANFHARNHIFRNGKRITTIDFTPHNDDDDTFKRNMSEGEPVVLTRPNFLEEHKVEKSENAEQVTSSPCDSLKKKWIEVGKIAFPKGIRGDIDRHDPFFVVGKAISTLFQGDEKEFAQEINNVRSSRELLKQFLSRSIENSTLTKLYPHYLDPRVSAGVSELLEETSHALSAAISSSGT